MRIFLRYEIEKEMMYVSQLLKAGHQMRVPNQYAREPAFWKVALFSQDVSGGVTDVKKTRNTKLILDHTPFQL